MQRDSDEDAWRSIVDNYGERIELEEDPQAEPPQPVPAPAALDDLEQPAETGELPAELDDARFVPPTPPPLPHVPPDRLAAWTGLFGSPTLLLICLVLGINLPPLLGYLLVAWFIGGFVYLVVKMPRGPSDPWDDGARL